jgi:hypothetical protein
MKTRKILYLFLGVMFTFTGAGTILIVLIYKISFPNTKLPHYSYFVVHALMAVCGILFIRAAKRIQKKINEQKRQALVNAFND